MLAREDLLARLDAAYAARARGDKEALRDFWAPGATFQLMGDQSVLRDLPSGICGAECTVEQLIDQFQYQSVERVSAVVDGNRAVVQARIIFSVNGGPLHTLDSLDLFEMDDEGRAVSLCQFTDTALIAQALAADGARATG